MHYDEGLMLGAMANSSRLGNELREANREISEWRDYASQLESQVNQLKRDNAALRAENQNLRLQGAVDAADGEAVRAVAGRLIAEAVVCDGEHPLGKDRSKRIEMHQEAFDEAARKRGIENPEDYR